jgi:hypothetical protein
LTTEEVALALEEWASTVRPTLNTFPNDPGELSKALPLVLCEIKGDRIRRAEDVFPEYKFQQTEVRVWTPELLILEDPDPAWTASQNLYAHVDGLGAALRTQGLIGGVLLKSKYYESSYDPPEVEHDDGTVARAVTMRVTVGEQIGASR